VMIVIPISTGIDINTRLRIYLPIFAPEITMVRQAA
jgi:hypothetical protein